MKYSSLARIWVPILAPITLLGLVLAYGFSLSRLFLALPPLATVGLAVALAAIIFFTAFAVEYFNLSQSQIGYVLAIGLILVLAMGVVGSVMGQREFHTFDANNTSETHNNEHSSE